MDLIERLTHLTSNKGILAGLRTVRQSLILFDKGLRIYNDNIEGDTTDPVREEAIAANVLDVIRAVQPNSLLGLYGFAHVQKGGGGIQFPLSDRLEKAGVMVYRTVCYPLTGASIWRQHGFEYPVGPAASDFKLSSGKTIEDVLENVPDSEFLYLNFAKGIQLQVQNWNPNWGAEPIAFPSEQFDSYIFLREVTPMKDQCLPVTELKWETAGVF